LLARPEPTSVEPLTGLHSYCRLPALPANIRLWWKEFAVANTLAYYVMAPITAVTGFIVPAPGKIDFSKYWRVIHIAA